MVKNRTEAGSNKRQGEEHIIEKCREAESSEVKSLRWSEKLPNAEGSEVQ